MSTHLFVYGTLLSGIPSSMSKFLSRKGELIGPATTEGRLYDLGLYPGFVPGEGGSVGGELHRIDPEFAEMTWEMLDAYEGVTGEPEDEYRRSSISVRTAEGEAFTADTYVFLGDVAKKSTIPDGDYRRFFAATPAHQRFVNGG